jgi:UDP-glucose 4-epimerase
MILVTGGSGFIGSHTVRALTDLGESCVLIQRRSAEVPFHLVDLPVVSERADVTDLDALRAVGARYKITGIVHLAGYPAPRGSVGGIEATEDLLRGLINVVRVASEWEVGRIGLASTIGVYSGVQHVGPLTEDMPVLLTAPHPIPRSKKIGELLGEQFAESTGIEIINLRISGTWGPAGHEDPFFAAPALIHAAASRSPLNLSGLLVQPHLGDGLDLCYVKDTGRAIALLQVAEHLNYRTYNVASGRLTQTRTSSRQSAPSNPTSTSNSPTAPLAPATRSTSPACTTTPATSPSTTLPVPYPTTSHGCEQVTAAERTSSIAYPFCAHDHCFADRYSGLWGCPQTLDVRESRDAPMCCRGARSGDFVSK